MIYEKLHLKDVYPVLGQEGRDPILEVYCPHSEGENQRQDWTQQEKKRPCILLCPGGGYYFVSQREGEPVAVHFLPEGYNVFVLTYSVAPHTHPAQLREVAAAMELIHSRAQDWNCDTERIALMGFSAGGHLAAHYSNRYDCPQVREVFPDSKPVRASVLCYPVITGEKGICHEGSFKNLLGHEVSDQERQAFSCHNMVTEKTPPALIWHTAQDTNVPVQSALLYAQALADKKIPFGLYVYPFGPHARSTADAQTCDQLPENQRYLKDWLPTVKNWLALIFEEK